MCGIIGYIGQENATPILIESLRRLEYRGYDSAGIAIINGKGIEVRRAQGKLNKLEHLLVEQPIHGTIGIGHTRWATHGRPSEMNAHPHRSGKITVVHNGIIENHNHIKTELLKKGHVFESETDTEVICHLIDEHLKTSSDMLCAIQKALAEIRGSYAFVIMHEDERGRLYVAKHGSPLVASTIEGATYVASDVPALLPYTKNMLFLEDGDIAVLERGSITVLNQQGKKVTREEQHIPWNPLMAERGGYKHFMLKEIYEQPNVFEDTLMGRVSVEKGEAVLTEIDELCGQGQFPYEQIVILACGTSRYAGMVGKYMIEEFARLPVTVELASEFRYRPMLLDKKTLVIPITQSGETADTLAAMQLAKEAGCSLLSVCNVVGSSITRAAHATLYTHAGPEIGVASTKAFTAQMTVLALLALDIAKRRKTLAPEVLKNHVLELLKVPSAMQQVLAQAKNIRKIAVAISSAHDALFIGRGVHYPLALEGALKLKEISYIHAEGFAAGELKHGPIALVDNGVPVIAIALRDAVYEKILSNIEEVRARGADLIVLADDSNQEIVEKAKYVIRMPHLAYPLSALVAAVPLQLLAYYVADHKGTDVDQPRNLAKSVTVE